VRATIAYDGAPFHGFASNPEVVTIQGEIERALTVVLRHLVQIGCAGRTDRGVHARGQVISFDADLGHFEPVALTRAFNRMLDPSIVMRDVELVDDTFDARLSCIGRSYRYRILNSKVPDPLLTDLVWHVRDELDLRAMNVATDRILGLHDFSTFSKRNKSRPTETFLRRVHHAQWRRFGETVQFDITANAFTHQMVRTLVGYFVDIGLGRRRAADLGAALAAMDRAVVGSPAPPHALILWSVKYGDGPVVKP